MKRRIIIPGQISIILLLGCVFLSLQTLAHAEVTLPNVISDNMVLQRDVPVPIWGWAAAGEEVTVTLQGSDAEATYNTTTTADAKGKWQVTLPVTPAGGPYTLHVAATNALVYENVLFGEVWVCSGQSNMEWPVRASKDSDTEIAAAIYPMIRLFDVPHKPSGLAMYDVNAKWHPTTPETIENFSAVAYYFGRKLYENLNVPIGLINTSWGGTRIEPWTPLIGFQTVPALESVAKEVQTNNATYRKELPRKIKAIEAWIAETREALAAGDVTVPMPENRHPLAHHARPTGLYNGMVHPLVPFAIRGAIWYQGESNLRDSMMYHEKMKALITGWRKVWRQGEFPFYFVQLAPYDYSGWDVSPFLLPEIWEAQTATWATVPHTGMAVTTDIGNPKDIHPRNKQAVGRRLALFALAKTYNRTDITYSGPLYKSMKVENNTIRILFDYATGGLMSRDGEPLTRFEIAGQDKHFVEAVATIDGNTIVVSSDTVLHPVAVRFGWHHTAEPNLINNAGLPASPFRTHRW